MLEELRSNKSSKLKHNPVFQRFCIPMREEKEEPYVNGECAAFEFLPKNHVLEPKTTKSVENSSNPKKISRRFPTLSTFFFLCGGQVPDRVIRAWPPTWLNWEILQGMKIRSDSCFSLFDFFLFLFFLIRWLNRGVVFRHCGS